MSRPSSLPGAARAASSSMLILLGGWLMTVSAAEAAETTPAPAATAGPAEAAPATGGAAPAEPVPTKAAPPARRDPDAALPLRLGVFYGHAFGQSGDLTRNITFNGGTSFQLPSPSVVGVDVGTGLGSHVRYHFGVGLEWEGQSQPNYAAKGFRIDLAGIGFPILVWSNEQVAIHVEPLLHLIRGEILFQSAPPGADTSLFRIESGLAAAITVVTHDWYFGIEPFALDFRVFEANNKWVHTGFSHLFWFQLAAGYEF
ncbi:MAG TPA: hypothetical protein VIU64_03615 [Polyangia bacterium]